MWTETPPYDLVCLATDILLYSSAEEWRHFNASPEGQRVAAYFARLARQRSTHTE